MKFKFVHHKFVCLVLILQFGSLRANDIPKFDEEANFSLPLASTTPDDDLYNFRYDVLELVVPKHIKMNDINDYHEIVLPAYSNTAIQLRQMGHHGRDVGFALIQINAYEFNVTLSYNATIVDGTHLTGQNVGLVLYEDGSLYAINTNVHEDVMVSLVLMLYNKTAPLPGGCNLEFPVEISPVMNLTLGETTIQVDTPPASLAKQIPPPENQCGKSNLRYESYYLSMPSYDFSQRTYFSYIRKLISYANAKASGQLNNLTSPALTGIKRVYDRQVGRGMVFVTVAIDPVNHGFAAYVPVHTYACRPFLNIVGCYEFNIPTRVLGFLITVVMAAEIVIGFCPAIVKAFICGGLVGAFGTIKATASWNLVVTEKEFIAMLVAGAIVCAVVFTVLAALCPIAMIIVCNVVIGFLLCSVFYFGFFGNVFIHKYLVTALLLSSTLVGFLLSSIKMFLFANGFLFGAAGLFYGVNAVFSARLHYSLRNVAHGMLDAGYGAVLSDSTLDVNELMAGASFVIILTICVYLRVRCQLAENQRVPPGLLQLPCGDRRGSRTSEAFLADDSFAYENVSGGQTTITRWTDGDDDVFESPESNSRFWARLRSSIRQQ
uniref:TM7S3/TM198-like domain-containing protein n=1 Tax=Culex tarsalis TaxID=7177 RepID=A0A1Q3FE33_CULTA